MSEQARRWVERGMGLESDAGYAIVAPGRAPPVIPCTCVAQMVAAPLLFC